MKCVKAVWPETWQRREVTNNKAKCYSLGLMNTLMCCHKKDTEIMSIFCSLRCRDYDKTLQQFRLSSRASFGWLPFHTCCALDCDSLLSWRSGCFIKLLDLCLTRSFELHGINLVGQEAFLHALFQCCGLACIISPRTWVSGFFQKHFTMKRTSSFKWI